MVDEAHSRGKPRTPIVAPAEQDIPTLVARLGDDVLELVEGKLALLKLDLEDTARGYGRTAVRVGLAAATLAIGIALAACGLAFAVAYVLPADLHPLLARASAFGLVGTIAIALGAMVLWNARTLLRRDHE